MLNTQSLLENLQTKGWYYQKNAIDQKTIEQLQVQCRSRIMNKAGIGQNKAINTEIRSDVISWLDVVENDLSICEYQQILENLRTTLNEHFYLGLRAHEAHFARYEKGCFYKKHKDSFSKKNKRAVTFILYLNDAWQPEDGGELRLYDNASYVDIEPVAGSIICFMSDEIEHEVLLSHNTRQSLTAWLLRD